MLNYTIGDMAISIEQKAEIRKRLNWSDQVDDEEISAYIRTRIRELRKSHHVTQAELSTYLGFIATGSVTNIELGRTQISANNLIKIADFFGVSLSTFHPQPMRERQ